MNICALNYRGGYGPEDIVTASAYLKRTSKNNQYSFALKFVSETLASTLSFRVSDMQIEQYAMLLVDKCIH